MNQEFDKEFERQVKTFIFISFGLSGFGFLLFSSSMWSDGGSITTLLMMFMFVGNSLLVIFVSCYETLNAVFNKRSLLLDWCNV